MAGDTILVEDGLDGINIDEAVTAAVYPIIDCVDAILRESRKRPGHRNNLALIRFIVDEDELYFLQVYDAPWITGRGRAC